MTEIILSSHPPITEAFPKLMARIEQLSYPRHHILSQEIFTRTLNLIPQSTLDLSCLYLCLKCT